MHINLGAGESEVSSPRGLRLDDLAWHDVRIERENADLQLTIDGIYKNRSAGADNMTFFHVPAADHEC